MRARRSSCRHGLQDGGHDISAMGSASGADVEPCVELDIRSNTTTSPPTMTRSHDMTTVYPAVLTLGLSLAVALGGAASMVHAHSGASGVVKERMQLMKGMGDAMKTMGAMFKGEAPFEPDVVAEEAAHLAEHARKIPEVTPAGSIDHPSEALPIIWQDWDGYVESAEMLAERGTVLVEIASNGADPKETRAQFLEVSKTCGTCHDKFRRPKDK
jgi:cytochrome c556